MGRDPNQPVKARQNNFFYVRAKNLGTQSQGGQAYLYWSKASLLLTPSNPSGPGWYDQPLQVSIGGRWQTNNPLSAVSQNGITVSQQPFAWTPPPIGPNDHFCLVGAVGTSLHAWPPLQPPTFANADAFVLWVRNNQNICWRNLSLVSNPSAPQWDRVDGLYNQWSEDKVLVVIAKCTNIPSGTQVTLKSTALGIDTTQQITDPSQWVIGNAVRCPGGFDGYIETTAVLAGGRWPDGARIRTVAYFSSDASSPVARFAEDFGDEAGHPHVARALELAGGVGNGVLVEIGNCATAYTGGGAGALG